MAGRMKQSSNSQRRAGGDRVRRALVHGCGGVAGAAWSIPVLAELERRLGWDAREADVFVGTSVGGVLVALLSAGVGVDRMLASQRGDADARCWDHDRDTGGALPPLPGLRMPGARLVVEGLRGNVSAMTAALGLLPDGRSDMRPFERLIEGVVPGDGWTPHPATWIVAVDAASGARVPIGRADAPAMPLRRAVCASYAVPAWCPSVTHAGRTYLDGGIASPTSADLLIGSDVQEAIVLAPMASTHPDAPRSPLARIERRARRTMTAIVDREVRALEAAGIRVVRIEPSARDLTAIGFNMMDPGRRRRVFETSLATAPATVAAALERGRVD